MSIKKNLIAEFCHDLHNYVQQRFGYKTKCGYHNKRNIVNIDRNKVNLYIRYNFKNWSGTGKTTLVLARISFKKIQKGEGTHLLRFLLDKQKKYGYEEIGIESCNEGATIFAQKLGFKLCRNDGESYYISMEDLKKKLKDK